jgi:hypothetical protein
MRWGVTAIAVAVAVLALSATSATAATTRAEYVAQVDPICLAGLNQEAVAANPLLKAVKRAKRHPGRKTDRRLSRALRSYFGQYTAIEHSVNDQIAAVPPAPDDVSLVGVWLRARGELIDLEGRLFISKPKGHGLKGFAQLFSSFFTLTARQLEVSDLIRDFGFQYCDAPPPEAALVEISPSDIASG